MWFWISGWFLVALALVGNGIVIYFIMTSTRLQTRLTNWFVLSVAVADVCVALTFFPPLFGRNFLGFTFDTTHAGTFFKISFTFMYCSNANLFAMTMDRYIAVTRPLRYVAVMTQDVIFGLIAAAWTIPFLLFSLPAIFTYNDNPEYTMFVEVSRVIVFQMFPLVAFVGLTCHLLYFANKLARETRKMVTQVRFNQVSDVCKVPQHAGTGRLSKRGTTAMIVMIITAFNITYLGGNYQCICLLSKACPFEGTVEKIIHLVLIANSAVNPIVYAFHKKDFREELRKMFKLSNEQMVTKKRENSYVTTGFPAKRGSEKRLQRFHIDDVSLP